MSTHKYIDVICVVVLLLALVLTLLFINGTKLGMQAVVDEDAEQNSDSLWFTSADLNPAEDNADAVAITLSGDSGTIRGNGAYFLDGDLVITGGGTYVLTGSLTDGSVIVDAYASSKVTLVLDGVDIANSEDACILVKQADKVFLTLAQDSENTLTSADTYSDDAVDAGVDAVLYAKDDLTINGTGTLRISGGWKHGIAANDDLVITGGTITVEAVGDAIHANDSLRLCNAELNLTAQDDGIALTNEEEGEGYLYMESGTVSITSSDDGIHTTGAITIAGGALTISASDDGIHSDTSILVSGGTITIPQCYEGLEALTIEQTGGDITLYPTDDGFNANGGSNGFGNFGGGMAFPGGRGGAQNGTETTDSGDTADDTDSSQRPTPPDFASGEMPTFEEGERPTMPELADGEQPTFSQSERPTMSEQTEQTDQSNDSAQSDEPSFIRISGGTLTIINETGRDADGLDSNGDIYISGGTVLISVPGDGSNSAIDYGSESGGVAEITGGTVIACGSSSMAEQFDSSSTQASFLYSTTQTLPAGTELKLTDADGNVLLQWTLPCSATSICMSSPDMVQGGTYTLTMGEQSEELTLESVSTAFGSTSQMGFGGGMGGGWGGFGGGRGGRNPFSEASDTTDSDDTQDA